MSSFKAAGFHYSSVTFALAWLWLLAIELAAVDSNTKTIGKCMPCNPHYFTQYECYLLNIKPPESIASSLIRRKDKEPLSEGQEDKSDLIKYHPHLCNHIRPSKSLRE